MDLSKIISELRTELKCLQEAIASMEELARVQNVPEPGKPVTPPDPQPVMEPGGVPIKRGRGRPRKHQPTQFSEQPKAMAPSSEPSDNGSAASAA